MSKFDEDFHAIFDPIAKEFNDSLELPTIPFEVSLFQYVGIGSFVPEAKPTEAPLVPFLPSLPTMTLERKRDMFTGEVIGYEDMPIWRDDCGSMEQIDTDRMAMALDTGQGLMRAPWNWKFEDPETPVQSEPEDEEQYKAIVDDWDVRRFEEEVTHPAHVFPYELDAWQKRAIRRLEMGECVFVSAPTAAGKTVVAQYAFSLSMKHNKRAIYTCQTKALSNQKYREFSNGYDSVGLVTGDVEYNRDASLIVTSNECLREMVYNQLDMFREVEFVVFDEWFYCSDDDRNVVWEECIMAMPEQVNMVFLSATIPNDTDFADWIARTKHRMVYIERHEKRPVPLEHYLYVKHEFFCFYSEGGLGSDKDYAAAESRFPGDTTIKKTGCPQLLEVQYLLKDLKKRDMLPALIFLFSQKHIEEIGNQLLGSWRPLGLIGENEKRKITEFTKSALSRLSPEDRKLEDVTRMVKLMEKGIGVHHGGILPILKECVEILFADGLLKVLFCTETFAIGINVPVRTCVFAQMKKYNDRKRRSRYLSPREYIQMGGRAGRRGVDEKGHVVIWCTQEVPRREYLQEITGEVQKLESAFHVEARMVLNQIGMNAGGINQYMERSFHAEEQKKDLLRCQQQLDSAEQSLKELLLSNGSRYNWKKEREKACSFARAAKEALSVIKWLHQEMKQINIGIGSIVLVAAMRMGVVTIGIVTNQSKDDRFDVLTPDEMRPRAVSLLDVIGVFRDKMDKFDAAQARMKNATKVQDKLREILDKNSKPIRLKDQWKGLSKEMIKHLNKLDSLYEVIIKSKWFGCAQKAEHIQRAYDVITLKQRRDELLQSPCQREIDSCIRYLTELGYISDGAITLKGQIASDDILASELLYRNIFTELPPEDICAVCSALCAKQSRRKDGGCVPEHLNATTDRIQNVAEELCDRMIDKGLKIDREQWLREHFHIGVVGAVYLWARGESFAMVVKSAKDIPSGALVGAMSATSKLIDFYSRAAMAIGNAELSRKFEDARVCIRHGIVDCPSLYTT